VGAVVVLEAVVVAVGAVRVEAVLEAAVVEAVEAGQAVEEHPLGQPTRLVVRPS
jgi:hypothetical protein